MKPMKMDRRIMALVAFAHTANDLTGSFLPAILPLLVAQRHLTYAAAATLVLAQGLSSSVVQPVAGYLADRRPMPWLIAVGVSLAGAGIAAVGVMDSYAAIFCAVLVAGFGSAMFHPDAARFANLAAGEKKASGVRWFSLGGSIGFAIGPAFATTVILAFGMKGTLLALVPAAIVATLALLALPKMRVLLENATAAAKGATALPDDWSAFARLVAFIAVRSSAYIGMVSFIPLYFVNVVHASPVVANGALTAFLVVGIIGTFVGGGAADTFGRRAVLIASALIALTFTPLLVPAAGETATPLHLVLGYIVCALVGFALTGALPAQIVLGQEYLPNRMGTASGVTLGLSFTLGGLFAPVLGTIGDHWGLSTSILVLAAVSLVSLPFALSLPDPVKRRALLLARAAP
jgi:FSR family fosmidomycin resistance protein-like MFS transporter